MTITTLRLWWYRYDSTHANHTHFRQRPYFWLALTHIDISRIISYYVLYDLTIYMKHFWPICYTTFYCMLDKFAESLCVWVLHCIVLNCIVLDNVTWFDMYVVGDDDDHHYDHVMMMTMIFNLFRLSWNYLLEDVVYVCLLVCVELHTHIICEYYVLLNSIINTFNCDTYIRMVIQLCTRLSRKIEWRLWKCF